MIGLPQRRLRIEPLRVLLIAVEDERRADESVVDQPLHVLHRRTVSKGEAELRLYALLLGEGGGAARFAKIVRHGLLAQDVLSRLQRSPCQLEMRCARRTNIDEIDVGPRDQFFMRRVDVGNSELLRKRLRAFDDRIGDGHDLTTRVAFVTAKMRGLRPRSSAEYSDADRHRISTPVSPGNSNMRCARIG